MSVVRRAVQQWCLRFAGKRVDVHAGPNQLTQLLDVTLADNGRCSRLCKTKKRTSVHSLTCNRRLHIAPQSRSSGPPDQSTERFTKILIQEWSWSSDMLHYANGLFRSAKLLKKKKKKPNCNPQHRCTVEKMVINRNDVFWYVRKLPGHSRIKLYVNIQVDCSRGMCQSVMCEGSIVSSGQYVILGTTERCAY